MRKRERNIIYKKTLEDITELNHKYGLCVLLLWVHMKMYNNMGMDIDMSLPEFVKCKPKNTKSNAYWFCKGIKGYNQRVKVLKKCIELTNPKPRKKKIK